MFDQSEALKVKEDLGDAILRFEMQLARLGNNQQTQSKSILPDELNEEKKDTLRLVKHLINLKVEDVDDHRFAEQEMVKANIVFREIDFRPSPEQFATAYTILKRIGDFKRQIWLAGAGRGKSRIISSIIYLLQHFLKNQIDKVVVVFSSPDNQRVD